MSRNTNNNSPHPRTGSKLPPCPLTPAYPPAFVPSLPSKAVSRKLRADRRARRVLERKIANAVSCIARLWRVRFRDEQEFLAAQQHYSLMLELHGPNHPATATAHEEVREACKALLTSHDAMLEQRAALTALQDAGCIVTTVTTTGKTR